MRSRWHEAKILCRCSVTKPSGRSGVRHGAAGVDIPVFGHEFEYDFNMQLRYNYRLDPRPRHRIAFGKAFGCARFVVNDALAFREAAYRAGLPYVTDADLSARLTAAKKAPERAWLTEVSSVVLQQALADLNTAYRTFFASRNGARKGPKVQKPRFRSARTTGRRSGSPPTPGSRSCPTESCACRRSATCGCGGRGPCPGSRPP